MLRNNVIFVTDCYDRNYNCVWICCFSMHRAESSRDRSPSFSCLDMEGSKAVRRYVFAFLAIPLACIGVFVHDFYANLNSGSVWVPAYDYFLPVLFGWGGSQMRIAKMRFDENRMEFDVVNFRRGPYRFAMSVPNRLGEFISVRHDIHFHCRFFREDGNMVYECDDTKASGWVWSDDLSNGGSLMTYGEYSVPENVPYNERLHVVVDFSGDVDGYRKSYPMAEFVIQKWYEK